MLTVRIVLALCFIKFIVLAFIFRKEGKPKKVIWLSLGIALFWLILFAITFFVHM